MNKTVKKSIRAMLPRSIRRHRILNGPLKGKWIITSWHDYPGAILGRTERPLLGWFEEHAKPGQTWLDIGAHYGYTAIALSSQVGEKGRVFAFEPMAGTAGCIEQMRHLNYFPQLTVIPMALSDAHALELGRLATERGMLDTTRSRTQAATEALMTTFLVTGLDWLWPQISEGNPRIDGIKIDVQGMEIHALRGMSNLLKTHRPKLAIEVHRGVDRKELLDFLAEHGYSKGVPIEPIEGEVEARYLDNRSYAFMPCGV